IISDAGDASITVQRALRYLVGNGVPQDSNRAYSLLSKAIKDNENDTLAWYYLGCGYECGLEPNLSKAEECYRKAMEQGHSPAAARLGMILIQLDGKEEARTIFKEALKNNDMVGAYGIGLLEELGGNNSEAIEYYSIAAEMGYAPAQNSIGCMYAEGKQGDMSDVEKAAQWFELAVEQNLLEAMTNLGMILTSSNYSKDYSKRGMELLHDAAEKGELNASEILKEMEQKKLRDQRMQRVQASKGHSNNVKQNNGGELVSAFLRGLDLGGIASYAKGKFTGDERD
ncbi:MAG: sel1 repeat family protein, partial [Muribaculaceae bacterium]|nr:sel1 repeat family protein [Muribaculaceae bacterium]